MNQEQLKNWHQEDIMHSDLNDEVYLILFGKTTKEMREERGVEMFEPLRDHFTIDELRKISMTESEINDRLVRFLRVNKNHVMTKGEILSVSRESARMFRSVIFV